MSTYYIYLRFLPGFTDKFPLDRLGNVPGQRFDDELKKLVVAETGKPLPHVRAAGNTLFSLGWTESAKHFGGKCTERSYVIAKVTIEGDAQVLVTALEQAPLPPHRQVPDPPRNPRHRVHTHRDYRARFGYLNGDVLPEHARLICEDELHRVEAMLGTSQDFFDEYEIVGGIRVGDIHTDIPAGAVLAKELQLTAVVQAAGYELAGKGAGVRIAVALDD